MISFEHITKTFKPDFWAKGFMALDHVNFSIPEGKIVGFLGANGAGKTTSLKILMGFIRATKGKVHFSEKLGKTKREILSQIGYMPERPYFYPHLTGSEFIHYLAHLCDVKNSDLKNRKKYWGEALKIDFAFERKIRSYSKGMLQRLGFLVSLIHDPKIIIMDEPLSGLDPIGRKEFKDAIIKVNKEGKTVFFSSHIVPDVEEVCETVIFLEKGKRIYEGSIDDLIAEKLKT